jgi:hypothetical protein
VAEGVAEVSKLLCHGNNSCIIEASVPAVSDVEESCWVMMIDVP